MILACFTMLCQFLLYSKVNQLYIYTSIRNLNFKHKLIGQTIQPKIFCQMALTLGCLRQYKTPNFVKHIFIFGIILCPRYCFLIKPSLFLEHFSHFLLSLSPICLVNRVLQLRYQVALPSPSQMAPQVPQSTLYFPIIMFMFYYHYLFDILPANT